MRLLVPALVGAGLWTGCAPEADPPRGIDGRLDASSYSFDHELALEGAWLARTGADSARFAAFDYDASHWDTVAVPGLFERQGYPAEGLVWYRLELRLPRRRLAAFAEPAMNAGALYAATPGSAPVRLGGNGLPALASGETVLSRSTSEFELPADTALVLTWKVANYDYLSGGPTDPVVIGDAAAMHRRAYLRSASTFMAVGLYLMLGVTFLFYWAWHRVNVASLAVSLLAFTAALRSLTVEGLLEPALPGLAFHTRIALEGATFFALLALLYATLWAFSPLEFLPLRLGRRTFIPAYLAGETEPAAASPMLSRFWRGANSAGLVATVVVATAFAVGVCVSSIHVQSRLIAQFRWFSLAAAAMGILLLIQIARCRRRSAVGLLVGYGSMVLAGVHDILVSQGLIFPGHPPLTPASLIGVMLIQSYMVARRSARHAEFVRQHAGLLEEEVSRQTRELSAATAEAQRANDAKSRFLAAITHELRTPLNGIIGFADLLKDEMTERGLSQEHHFADLIEISGRRLLALVNDLLDMAKVESGRLTLHVECVDVDDSVRDVVRQMHPFAARSGLTFEARTVTPGLKIDVDPDRLHQVLVNLLSNAFKFTKDGLVAIEVEQDVIGGDRAAASIRVVDTGMGIQADFLPHLFDRFTQQERSSGRDGTGLGLAITRELVDRMHGSITVESEAGKGSTFTVRFPLAAPPAEDDGTPPAVSARNRE